MLLLTGLNHHTTPVELREQCYVNAEQLPSLLYHLKGLAGVSEAVVISTCNRLEAYIVVNGISDPTPIVKALCDYYGLDFNLIAPHFHVAIDDSAVHHLMRVACGLDSLVLGEAQILGQVRDALEAAANIGTAGALLHRLFETAAHTGKRAQHETEIGTHSTSVSHAAARLLLDRTDYDPEILIIGTGEMARLAALALIDRGAEQLTFINRTYAHAHELANAFHGSAAEWSRLWEKLSRVDAVISATGAPHPILYAEDMKRVIAVRHGKPLLLVDIAVPRDIDTAVRGIEGLNVFDVDDLQEVVDENISQRKTAVPQVEEIVREEAARYGSWLRERSVTPVIRQMRGEVREMVQQELAEALRKLDGLDDAERAVIERMAHRITNKVLHAPTVSLRERAADGEAELYMQLVSDLFSLNMVEAS